jgi:prevent-host-death family protein
MAKRPMATVTMRAAKIHLSRLLARVEAGEEIVIARRGTPIGRLTAIHAVSAERQFGALKGVLSIGPAFFEPVMDVELAEWG